MIDQKFLALWVLVWQPIVHVAFVLNIGRIADPGDLGFTAMMFLAYVYILFAPPIYWLFIRKEK